jgi:hypothetical protein
MTIYRPFYPLESGKTKKEKFRQSEGERMQRILEFWSKY